MRLHGTLMNGRDLSSATLLGRFGSGGDASELRTELLVVLGASM